MDYIIFEEKAIESLKSAEILFEKELYNNSVSRAYYSMFQIAVAILMKDGKQFGNRIDHVDVIRFFVEHYCNKTKIFAHFRQYLKDIQLIRNEADYKDKNINKINSNKVLKKAKEFVHFIRGIKFGDEL